MATLCLLLQVASATFLVRDFESPNAAADIAQTIVRQGEFLYPPTQGRAYHLPGEPLYLAVGFATLPQSLWRYLHVPVTGLLVTCLADAAFTAAGPALALAVGIVASVEPFMISHGPVWDDTFLAAALEWLIFAILLRATARARLATDGTGPRRAITCLAVATCAAAAALTRLQSQIVLAGIAVAALAGADLRPIRALLWAVVAGLAVGIGAWGVRNAVVIGHFFISTSHDGKVLEMSTAERAPELIFRIGQVGGFSPESVDASDEVQVDRQLRRIAWRHVFAHKLEFLRTAALKSVVTLSGVDLGRAVTSWRNLVALGSSVFLLVAGGYGLQSLWRRPTSTPTTRLVRLFFAVTALVTMVLQMVGPVGLRYRLPLSLFLCLGAGVLALRAGQRAGRALQPLATS